MPGNFDRRLAELEARSGPTNSRIIRKFEDETEQDAIDRFCLHHRISDEEREACDWQFITRVIVDVDRSRFPARRPDEHL